MWPCQSWFPSGLENASSCPKISLAKELWRKSWDVMPENATRQIWYIWTLVMHFLVLYGHSVSYPYWNHTTIILTIQPNCNNQPKKLTVSIFPQEYLVESCPVHCHTQFHSNLKCYFLPVLFRFTS